jgi:hypothetical protein
MTATATALGTDAYTPAGGLGFNVATAFLLLQGAS